MWGPDGLMCMEEAELSYAGQKSMTNNCEAARARDPASPKSPGAWKSHGAYKKLTNCSVPFIHLSIPLFGRHLLSADNVH